MCLVLLGLVGIIPADAGSTIADALQAARHADHPRVCGEHVNNVKDHWDEWGSSPRMRGALPGSRNRTGGSGIIPAYAGSTKRVRECAL